MIINMKTVAEGIQKASKKDKLKKDKLKKEIIKEEQVKIKSLIIHGPWSMGHETWIIKT